MALKAISHDKKSINNNISVVKVNKVGEFIIENETIEELSNMEDYYNYGYDYEVWEIEENGTLKCIKEY